MARRLLLEEGIMQIPYDLEFIENRPTVRVIAVRDSHPAWRAERPRREEDAFDALLRLAHRLLQRLEKH